MVPQIIEKNSTPLRNEVPFCIKYSMNKVDLKFLQNYCHVTAYTIPNTQKGHNPIFSQSKPGKDSV